MRAGDNNGEEILLDGLSHSHPAGGCSHISRVVGVRVASERRLQDEKLPFSTNEKLKNIIFLLRQPPEIYGKAFQLNVVILSLSCAYFNILLTTRMCVQ